MGSQPILCSRKRKRPLRGVCGFLAERVGFTRPTHGPRPVGAPCSLIAAGRANRSAICRPHVPWVLSPSLCSRKRKRPLRGVCGFLAERVGFEPTWGDYAPIRFRVGAVMTASVPLHEGRAFYSSRTVCTTRAAGRRHGHNAGRRNPRRRDKFESSPGIADYPAARHVLAAHPTARPHSRGRRAARGHA